MNLNIYRQVALEQKKYLTICKVEYVVDSFNDYNKRACELKDSSLLGKVPLIAEIVPNTKVVFDFDNLKTNDFVLLESHLNKVLKPNALLLKQHLEARGIKPLCFMSGTGIHIEINTNLSRNLGRYYHNLIAHNLDFFSGFKLDNSVMNRQGESRLRTCGSVHPRLRVFKSFIPELDTELSLCRKLEDVQFPEDVEFHKFTNSQLHDFIKNAREKEENEHEEQGNEDIPMQRCLLLEYALMQPLTANSQRGLTLAKNFSAFLNQYHDNNAEIILETFASVQGKTKAETLNWLQFVKKNGFKFCCPELRTWVQETQPNIVLQRTCKLCDIYRRGANWKTMEL